SYTFAPSRAVPLPSGSPSPLGAMLMSKRASSAALTGSPKRAACVSLRWGVAQPTSAAAVNMAMRLGVDMFHAPIALHRPAHDRVVMEARVGRIARKPVAPQRLRIAFLIGRAALQHGAAA